MFKSLILSASILLLTVISVSGQEQKSKDTLIIAISNDFQPFTVVNSEIKAVAASPKEKHDAKIQKWVSVLLDDQIRHWVLAGVVGFTTFLGLAIYWNRQLAREIARQKQIEQALYASENQLRVIFETSEAGIILVSSSGIIEFANSSGGGDVWLDSG